jgi:hypothetical protein
MPLAWVHENHRVKDMNCQNPLCYPRDHMRLEDGSVLPECRAFPPVPPTARFDCLLPAQGAICGCPYRSKGSTLVLTLSDLWRKSPLVELRFGAD